MAYKRRISGDTHDDMQGIVGTASGASSLGTVTIRDTGFPILAFQNANDDVLYMIFQFSHRKKLDTPVDSVHIHYYLPNAPSAGNTVVFNYEWAWVDDGDVVPDTSTWTKSSKTHEFVGTEAQYSTGMIKIITNLSAPASEKYSSILLVKIVRNSTGDGADTYDSDLGMLYCDAHFIVNGNGSINETTD
jgi:hypothetical protein